MVPSRRCCCRSHLAGPSRRRCVTSALQGQDSRPDPHAVTLMPCTCPRDAQLPLPPLPRRHSQRHHFPEQTLQAPDSAPAATSWPVTCAISPPAIAPRPAPMMLTTIWPSGSTNVTGLPSAYLYVLIPPASPIGSDWVCSRQDAYSPYQGRDFGRELVGCRNGSTQIRRASPS
jgi:hypothetical protein